jgi:hypothetical protein
MKKICAIRICLLFIGLIYAVSLQSQENSLSTKGVGKKSEEELSSTDSAQQQKKIVEEEDVLHKIPQKVFLYQYSRVWRAVFHELKKYEFVYVNKVLGQIKTRWIDDTHAHSLVWLEGEKEVHAARFNLLVYIKKVIFGGHQAAKVILYKRQQMIVGDSYFWKSYPSDGLFEDVLFYRIERLLRLDDKLKMIKTNRTYNEGEKDLGEVVEEMGLEDIILE